jgi:hypothetical protein
LFVGTSLEFVVDDDWVCTWLAAGRGGVAPRHICVSQPPLRASPSPSLACCAVVLDVIR